MTAGTITGCLVVADPRICHGQPTFRGTRIMVKDVLDDLAQGLAWESIVDNWGGSLSEDAIAEAVRLAGTAFMQHLDDYVIETVPS